MSTIRLTRELIKECRTLRGGFTTATLRALGVEFDGNAPRGGWHPRLIGRLISAAKYEEAKRFSRPPYAKGLRESQHEQLFGSPETDAAQWDRIRANWQNLDESIVDPF